MKRKGFVSIGILLTMLLVLVVAAMGFTSTSGLRKTYENAQEIRKNYLLGENFVTYYQLFISEKIKEKYITIPYDSRYELEQEDIAKINFRLLNAIYGALTSEWYYEFKNALQNENTMGYLGYKVYSMQLTKQYYNPTNKNYIEYKGEINNSDFRVSIKMILVDKNGESKQLDTVIYFYVPNYDETQQLQWIDNKELAFDKESFRAEVLTRVGDTVVFG